MRRERLVLAVAAVGCAVFATPAAAGGTLTPAGANLVAGAQQIAGPSFAGDAIAWAAPSRIDRDYDVRVLRDGTLDTQHVFMPTGGVELSQAFAASAEAAALAVTVRNCAAPNCRGGTEVDGSVVFTGPIGQPLSTQLCGAGEFADSVDLDGSVLAHLSQCNGGISVRDLSAPPGTPFRTFPGIGRARIAGSYLAVAKAAEIVVYDWRSGEQLYKIDGPPTSFDISSDGVVTFTSAAYELDWASREEPEPHRIADAQFGAQVRVAGSRVALQSGTRFRVLERDGTELASTSALDVSGFDFDGTRLAMAVQPCSVTAIVSWDLQGDAPRMPPGRCPRARPATKRLRVDLSARALTVAVRCPAKPALGCSGEWAPRLYPTRSGSHSKLVALAPGRRSDVRFRLTRFQTCSFARGRVDAVGFYLAQGSGRRSAEPGSGRPAKLKRFRLSGRARGCKG